MNQHTTYCNHQTNGQKLPHAGNSGFKKLAVKWLNKHLCFVSSAVLVDRFVLRNRQLLKPAKRYLQVQPTSSATTNRQTKN